MKIGIVGITGRMGKSVARLVIENEITDIACAIAKSDDPLLGKDVGDLLGLDKVGVKVSDNIDELFQKSDVVIDFSSPTVTINGAKLAAQYKKTLISGTTGLKEEDKQKLAKYANDAVIVWSSNMSVGINLLFNLSQEVATILHDDYDVDVLEMHHNQKVDAPSGTALSLGEAVAKGRGHDFGEVSRKTRDGIIGKREKNEIGFASLRGGDVIGDHTVIFAGNGERIELTHKASNRDIYAKGALRAAIWSQGKENGFYSMRDVIGKVKQ
jgi:4-hydroxy-tetrahydrodipicolinate reductase